MEVALQVSLEYPLVRAWSSGWQRVKEVALRDTRVCAVHLCLGRVSLRPRTGGHPILQSQAAGRSAMPSFGATRIGRYLGPKDSPSGRGREDFLFSGQVRPSAAALPRRTGPVLAPLRAAGPPARAHGEGPNDRG